MFKNYITKLFFIAATSILVTIPAWAEKNSPDWESYSNGLYYQSQALKASTRKSRVELLNKAIGKFTEAGKSGKSLEEVYYQISQCYYLMGKPDQSREYSEKAIAVKKDYFPAYNRIFGLYLASEKHEKAAKILEKYVSIKPGDAYPIYTLALHYYKNLKNSDKAMEKLDKIVVLSRKEIVPLRIMKKTYYLKGLVYLGKRDFSQGSVNFRKSYDIDNSDLNTLFIMTRTYMNYYNLVEAEKFARIFLKSQPENIHMNFVLGRIQYLKGDERAIETFSKLKKARNFESVTALALYYELTGDDVKAEKLLNAIVKYRNPYLSVRIAMAKLKLRKGDKADAYKSLVSAGTASFRNGLYGLAEELFYMALKIKSDKKYNIYYYLARTHEENKRYSMAISFYKKYYGLSGENNILTHIGYLYGVTKKYKSAYRYFEKSRLKDPESPSPYFFKGLVLVWNEKYAEANRSFDKAIELKNDEEAYHFYQAVAYERLNKIDKSIESLKVALKCNPRSARANNYLGYLYLENGMKFNEAYKHIEKALKYDPENGAYLDSMGWFYYKKNDYEEALRYLLIAEERLRLSDSIDSVVYDHIGDTYLKLGNKKMAVLYWKKSYELNKDKSIMLKINRN